MQSSDPCAMAVLDQFGSMLAKADTLDQVTDLRNRAEAVRSWARSAAVSLEMQNRAAELKLKAERKAGQLLAGLRLRGGDRKSNGRGDRLMLSDLGISQNQSKRWQKEAAIAEHVFQRYIRTANQSGKEVTTAGLLRFASQSAEGVPADAVTLVRTCPRDRTHPPYSASTPAGRSGAVGDLERTSDHDRRYETPHLYLSHEARELVEEIQNHHAVLCGLLLPICGGQQQTLLPGQRKGVQRYLSEIGQLLALLVPADGPQHRRAENHLSV